MRHTPETRALLSDLRRGDRNPMYGRKHSAETKAKLSAQTRERNLQKQYLPAALSVRIPEGVALGYLAGLVDGEGSIRFSGGRPFVAVYNTDKPLIDWIVANVGGPEPRPGDKRGRVPCYAWRISGARDVYAVCSALLPLLTVKRDDALSALAWLDRKYGEVMRGG